MSSLTERSHDLIYLLFEFRQVTLDNFPHADKINTQIIMNQDIAKPGYSLPVNLWMSIFENLRQVLGRLGQDLQVSQHRILSLCIAQERFFALRHVLFDAVDTFADVDQVKLIVLHSGRASSSTRSRMYQCKPSGSTISTLRPRSSSRSCQRAVTSRRLRPSSTSTRKSRSLS